MKIDLCVYQFCPNYIMTNRFVLGVLGFSQENEHNLGLRPYRTKGDTYSLHSFKIM
jgi:hypothetical protein